jgi:hypothetical protein
LSVEWNDDRGRALDPRAVPAAVGQSMLEQPVHDAGDVGTEPEAIGDRPGIDAAVDLAAPVRQVLVLPAAVLGEELGCAALAQDNGVEPPLTQRVERPRRRCPGLSARLGIVEVEVGGEERAARPLAVRVLEREEARTKAFGSDPRPRRFPDLGRFVQEITLDLPAQCRIGVAEPLDHDPITTEQL